MIATAVHPPAKRVGLAGMFFFEFSAVRCSRMSHKNSTDYIIRSMRTPRFWVLLLLSVTLYRPLMAEEAAPPADDETEESPVEAEPEDHISESKEEEGHGIIPAGAAVIFSSGPITPLSAYFEKNDYTSGLEALSRAQELAKKGDMEAASDLALEAYDDFMYVPLPRIRKKSKNKAALKKRREQIRADRRKAATLYIQSSIDYVQKFVKQTNDTKEGRARLNDLRDVAINYPDLNRMLYKAMDDMK